MLFFGPSYFHLYSTGSSGEEFFSITDNSILLVPHGGDASNATQWTPNSFSGFGTTNWAESDVSDERKFTAQAYTQSIGGATGSSHTGTTAPKSVMHLGYTSYFIQRDNVEIGDQQFFVSAPQGISYYLSGCPNLLPGDTLAGVNYVCPKKAQQNGAFKFTIVGLLSGAQINSLDTGTYSGASIASHSNDRDIAQYKTMLYRSTLDIGGMGAGVVTTLKGANCPHVGKTFDEISDTDDIADCLLSITGTKWGELDLDFAKYYSTGSFTRSESDLAAEFGYPCTGQMDACTRDLTGWNAAPDSFPVGANPGVQKLGTSSTPAATLRSMAGAPNLDVTEVRSMTITMRPAVCTGRPATPAAADNTGMGGVSWPGASQDCPWWYLVTSSDGQGNLIWQKDKDVAHGQSVDQDQLYQCESGTCYVIDFHIELGGQTLSERTVFGNPTNAANNGWDAGTFFIYDPRVTTDPADINWLIVIGVFAGIFCCLTSTCVCCFYTCRYFCCKRVDEEHAPLNAFRSKADASDIEENSKGRELQDAQL